MAADERIANLEKQLHQALEQIRALQEQLAAANIRIEELEKQKTPELVVFVAILGVPAHNNLAERSVRPLGIARKSSGGSRSPKGSATRMGLASLFGTWMTQGLHPFSQCLTFLTQAHSFGKPCGGILCLIMRPMATSVLSARWFRAPMTC